MRPASRCPWWYIAESGTTGVVPASAKPAAECRQGGDDLPKEHMVGSATPSRQSTQDEARIGIETVPQARSPPQAEQILQAHAQEAANMPASAISLEPWLEQAVRSRAVTLDEAWQVQDLLSQRDVRPVPAGAVAGGAAPCTCSRPGRTATWCTERWNSYRCESATRALLVRQRPSELVLAHLLKQLLQLGIRRVPPLAELLTSLPDGLRKSVLTSRPAPSPQPSAPGS